MLPVRTTKLQPLHKIVIHYFQPKQTIPPLRISSGVISSQTIKISFYFDKTGVKSNFLDFGVRRLRK